MKKILLAALAMMAVPISSFAISGSQVLVNSTGLAYSTAIAQNLLNFETGGGVADNLAVQSTFSSSTIAAATFTGGQASTGSITVVSTSSLLAAQATDTLVIPSTSAILGSPATGYITVIATTGLAGAEASFTTTLSNYTGIAASSPSITLDGQNTFTYAGNWVSTDTLAHAATTLANAINAGTTFTAAVANSTQVVITYISSGTQFNGFVVTSSSASDISTGTYSGGRNPVTITINNSIQNLTFTYGQNWVSSDTVNHAAATLQIAINGSDGNSGSDQIVAGVGGAIVASTANVVGTFANSFTMATSSAALVSVSSSNFSGGLNRALQDAYFSINGVNYKNGYHWSDAANTSTATLSSIVSFINGVSTANATCGQGIGNLTASYSNQTITMTQAIPCSAGNLMTLTVSAGSGMSAGSPTFTGGQDNASFNLGGIVFQYPTQWNLGASSTTTTTALSIAAAINANAIANKVLVATNTANVVNATSTVNGVSQNYSLTSSTIALKVVGFTGGLNTAFSSGSANIAIPAHNLTTGLNVLYTASAGSISGLTAGVTYYVIVVDSNNIQLALTSTSSLSGIPIVLRSTDTTTASHTFTLSPLSFTQGPAGAVWQVSNDGVNWATYSTTAFNVSVASYTFTAAGTTQVQDFGPINFSFIRLNITAPTQGATSLKVILATKD